MVLLSVTRLLGQALSSPAFALQQNWTFVLMIAVTAILKTWHHVTFKIQFCQKGKIYTNKILV